jgi:hypothetical protein
MMNIIRCLLFALLIVSCKKSGGNKDAVYDIDDSNCIVLSQHANWDTTGFRTHYTIQFPGNYTVTKNQVQSGIDYKVQRHDKSVNFAYMYCGSMNCYNFDNLPASFPEYVDYEAWGIYRKLDQKATFCDGNILTGVLYYDIRNGNSIARLFWKEDGKYKDALIISYNPSHHQEVLSIIKTIKRK